MNAARENVAILLTAGRSPLTETGLPGSRDGYIHWAQEMYDQAGCCARSSNGITNCETASSLATVVDRALAIAATEPRGPVYLSLPREVIAAPCREVVRSRCLAPAPGGRRRRPTRRDREAARLLRASEAAADRDVECRAATRPRLPRWGNSPSASQFRSFSIGRAISRCLRRIR